MRIEAETLRITASARLPDGKPYDWTVSVPVAKIMRKANPALHLFIEVDALLKDFPNLVEAYLSKQEK